MDCYPSLVRWCGSAKALGHGRRLHGHIRRAQLDGKNKLFIANLLVQMYGKCGDLALARAVFDGIPGPPNVFSWNLMASAYLDNGRPDKVLALFSAEDARSSPPAPDRFTFLSLLRASAMLGDLGAGREVHCCILAAESERGFEPGLPLQNALIHMYGKCGSPRAARAVFESIPDPDVISWTTLIAAFSENGRPRDALHAFLRMPHEEGGRRRGGLGLVAPNRVTYLNLLNAFSGPESLEYGRAIHQRILSSSFNGDNDLVSDVRLQNALLNMYGKCGSAEEARVLFDGIQQKDVVSWTAMVAAYAQNGLGKDALKLFSQMEVEGITPNSVTFLSALHACSCCCCSSSPSRSSLVNTKEIHGRIVGCGLHSDELLSTALLGLYSKCGRLEDARALFGRMCPRNVIAWTAMAAACAENGECDEALSLFFSMSKEGGVEPDRIAFLGALDACSGRASLESGRAIHRRLVAIGVESSDIAMMTALLNMYSKCGSLDDACTLFDEMPDRDVVSWNAMLAAYSQNGHCEEALKLFEEMGSVVAAGTTMPDGITFLSVLGICSRTGLFEKGWQYFISMSRDYYIARTVEHFVCLLDLCGRAGHLSEVEDLLKNMPILPDGVAWNSLLAACRIHGDIERATSAAHHIAKLNPADGAPYILLSQMYAAKGQWDEVADLRQAMVANGVKEFLGCS